MFFKRYLPVLVGLFLICTNTLIGATEKIAVVNTEKVFREYYKTQIAEDYLKRQGEIFRNWINKLEESKTQMEAEFKSLRDESQNLALKDNERETKRLEALKKQRDIVAKQSEIDDYTAQKSKEFQDLSIRKRADILQEISAEVASRAKIDGYSLVLDKSGIVDNSFGAVVYSDDKIDITDAVITALNRSNTVNKSENK